VHAKASALTFGLWGLYVLLLIGVSIWLIWLRRPCTILYQITPMELDEVLPGVIDRLKLLHTRRGPHWFLGYTGEPQSVGDPVAKGVVAVDGSAPMRYVSLRWQHGPAALRADVEAELARDLARLILPASPAATWLMTIAAATFTIMIFLLGTFLIVSFKK